MKMLAISGMIAVYSVFPAAAAKKKHSVSAATMGLFEACEKKAVDQGLVHGQTGHIEFVKECIGARPGSFTAPR
jgi:hypothetical protein